MSEIQNGTGAVDEILVPEFPKTKQAAFAIDRLKEGYSALRNAFFAAAPRPFEASRSPKTRSTDYVLPEPKDWPPQATKWSATTKEIFRRVRDCLALADVASRAVSHASSEIDHGERNPQHMLSIKIEAGLDNFIKCLSVVLQDIKAGVDFFGGFQKHLDHVIDDILIPARVIEVLSRRTVACSPTSKEEAVGPRPVESSLTSAAPGTIVATATAREPESSLAAFEFRRVGTRWQVAFHGHREEFSDSECQGYRFIGMLIAERGRQVSVFNLHVGPPPTEQHTGYAAADAQRTRKAGSVQIVLDEEAVASILARAEVIEDQLSNKGVKRADKAYEKLVDELRQLNEQMSRHRENSSSIFGTRSDVKGRSNTIRSSINRAYKLISKRHPQLQEMVKHLRPRIKGQNGHFAYLPGDSDIPWTT